MKLTTAMLILGMAAGTAWAQNPDVIDNTRSTMKAVEQKKAMDSNAALAASQGPAASTPTAAQPAAKSAAPKSSAPAKAPAAKKISSAPKVKAVPVAHTKPAAAKPEAKSKVAANSAPAAKQEVAVQDQKTAKDDKTDDKINLTGRRDPFVSPVVNRSMTGSGCSTGKRCLAIDQIALKGVVKSDVGMIAVVVNAVNKAYFLRENDPVFNGYVVKITTDSIVFKETLQDKLGKPFTREVEKKITTPAV